MTFNWRPRRRRWSAVVFGGCGLSLALLAGTVTGLCKGDREPVKLAEVGPAGPDGARKAQQAPGPASKPVSKPKPPLSPALARAAEKVRADELMKHVTVLCDPKLAGREAASPGARRAAAYIAGRFRAVGLRPGGQAGGYYQTFRIGDGHRVHATMEFEVGGKLGHEIRLERDFMPVHVPGGKAELRLPVTLVGYGIRSKVLGLDEYADLDVRGHAVLVFAGAPWDATAAAWIRRAEKRPVETLAHKAREAALAGAKLVLVVDDPYVWRAGSAAESLRRPDRSTPLDATLPVLHVTRALAARISGKTLAELRLMAAEVRGERESQSRPLAGRMLRVKASVSGSAEIGRNVIGVLPGRDSRLRKEAVVIGAHYDHLGEGARGIYFGANDNASGVAALLEIAAAMSALPKKPRRTIVFVAFAAEEIGRLGSEHYVRQPAVPLSRTVLMINFDMIGRNGANEVNAVATTSSPELHAIHQEQNRHVGLKLTHPRSYRLGLSDHTAFYTRGIPIMYLFGGRHPGYHTPADTADKLVPAKIERVARLALLTAWAVANRPARITFKRSDRW